MRRAVAAMARDHHELPDAGARHALAERHPAFQRDLCRQRQRARIIDVLGGNPDRLQRQEGHGDIVGQEFAHPRQIGLRDHDIGADGQMRAMLFGRRQRQHRDPSRRCGLGNVGPVDVGPVAGRELGSHRAECFFERDLQGSLYGSLYAFDRTRPASVPYHGPERSTESNHEPGSFAASVNAWASWPWRWPSCPAGAETTLDKVSFGTNWVPEAEHGGFFQAVADGTYERYGLDVTIVPGGPNDNNRMLLIAGKLDFFMAANTLMSFDAVANNVPVVSVAAIFQKDPQVFLTHPEAKITKLEELKPLTLFVSKEGITSYFQWLKSEYGFSETKSGPTPSIRSRSSPPRKARCRAMSPRSPTRSKRPPNSSRAIILLADYGFNTYSTLIETRRELIDKKPDLVQRFVDASIIGWYNYLYGDNARRQCH